MALVLQPSSTSCSHSKDSIHLVPSSSSIDSLPQASRTPSPSLHPSAPGCSKMFDPLASTLSECDFLAFLASQRVSFMPKSGARVTHDFNGFSASPATPAFQSDYYKSVVGLRVPPTPSISSVSHQVPCANSCTTIGSPVSLAITTSDDPQIDADCAVGVSASSMSSCAGLDYEGTVCCHDVAGSILDDSLLVQHRKSDALVSLVELMPGDSLCFPSQEKQSGVDDQSDVPFVSSIDSAELVEVNTPVYSGDPLARPLMICQIEQTQILSQRIVDVVPSNAPGSEIPINNSGCPTGISWSSVVEKNSHGGCCCNLGFYTIVKEAPVCL